MPTIEALREKLSKSLDEERYRHSRRVEEEAAKLAGVWGASEDLARVAGLLHDCSRFLDRAGMLSLAKKLKLSVDPVERSEPKLLHSRLSALIARSDYGIRDKEILQAIERHTIGSPKMSLLDKIVYLSDHIEPSRDFEGVRKTRALAYKDMNRAIVSSSGSMIKHLLAAGLSMHRGTIETRNYYLMNPSE